MFPVLPDNEYHTVDDLLKAAERQSDGKSTGDVSSEIEETLAKIKQQMNSSWGLLVLLVLPKLRNQEKFKN